MNAGCTKPESGVRSPGRCHRIDLSQLLLWRLNEGPGTLVL
jgi:hypothetical protein